jgi:hypothetical protein
MGGAGQVSRILHAGQMDVYRQTLATGNRNAVSGVMKG